MDTVPGDRSDPLPEPSAGAPGSNPAGQGEPDRRLAGAGWPALFGMGRRDAMNHRAATILEIVAGAPDGIDTVSLHRALYARGKGYGMTTLYRDIRRLCTAGALTRCVVEEDGRPIIRYCVSAALRPVVGTGHGQSLAGLRLPGGSGALATGPVPVAGQASPYAARGGLTYGRCELAVTRRAR